jgi:hypothetical protein
MTTLLEPPTTLAIGKPPRTIEDDIPGPPQESGESEAPEEEDV